MRLLAALVLTTACTASWNRDGTVPVDSGVDLDTADTADTGDTGEGPFDADGDGYTVDEGDCDDGNVEVNPGALEICNAVDDNCDEQVDEGVKGEYFADADVDGFGEGGVAVEACEAPEGYVANDDDCDDTRQDVFPGAAEPDCTDPVDYNCDGSTGYADADGDGFAACVECDDQSAAVHPDAAELCNDVDDDCSGLVDDDAIDRTTWYEDADADGWGTDASTLACDAPAGFAAETGDCDDGDAAFHPSAVEDDCTDGNDYNCDGSVAYADADADGFAACEDCDDGNADARPDAVELCNGVDDDCDLTVDEDDAADASTWYADADGDLFGDADATAVACEAPAAYVADATDCDDAAPATYPGADELCGGADEDCDGTVDEDDAADAPAWYADADLDGFGDADVSDVACAAPAGFVADDRDCDDARDDAFPGADELCDGVDNDCDATADEPDARDASTWYLDADADGWGDADVGATACDAPAGHVADATDCDDGAPGTHPGADEVCGGADEDCDGSVDESAAVDAGTWYADVDLDGYGAAATATIACVAPSGYVATAGDCQDAAAAVNPAGVEACDALDNDCDGSTDEAGATGEGTWYLDADGDGYGVDATAIACDLPAGYAAASGDCDDADGSVYPTATEADDQADDDCDGWVDEDFVVAGDVIVTEVTRQPWVGGGATNADAQWFEVWNASARTVDLSNWYVARTTTVTDAFYVDPDDAVVLAPGDYAVFCKTDNYTAAAQPTISTLVCDYVWGDETQASSYAGTYHDNTFNLQRDEDLLQLFVEGDHTTGALVDEVHWYYDATNGLWPRDAKRSMTLDPAALDATSNDTLTNWCSNSTNSAYRWWHSGSNNEVGTPGAANYDCP